MTVHQLQPELAETIAWYQTVFFIDASLSNREIEMKPLAPGEDAIPGGTHTTTPAMMVALSKNLYDRQPGNAIIGAVPAYVCDHGKSLSPLTARKVEEFVDRFAVQLLNLQASFAEAVCP
jgi:Ni,Fe-hydrogenase maturation factor